MVATRLALLDQPEFRDPRRIRELLEALETKERLLELLDEMLDGDGGVRVALGGEMGEPALSHCALVATRYGDELAPLGARGRDRPEPHGLCARDPAGRPSARARSRRSSAR